MAVKCSTCGCKIRGKNHEEGDHHKKRVKNSVSTKKS